MGFLDFIPIVGDVAKGISSVITTSMNNHAAKKNQQAAQDWNEKMNLQNQEWEEKMWNMNNEYNSPTAQVDRLLEAGINPNSAVGGMSQNATAAQPQQPTIPQMQGAPVFPYDLSAIGDASEHLLQKRALDLQEQKQEHDNNLSDAQAGMFSAQANLLREQITSMQIQNFIDNYFGFAERQKGYEKLCDEAAFAHAQAEGAKWDAKEREVNYNKLKKEYEELLPWLIKQGEKGVEQIQANITDTYNRAAKEAEQVILTRKQENLTDLQIEGQNEANYLAHLKNKEELIEYLMKEAIGPVINDLPPTVQAHIWDDIKHGKQPDLQTYMNYVKQSMPYVAAQQDPKVAMGIYGKYQWDESELGPNRVRNWIENKQKEQQEFRQARLNAKGKPRARRRNGSRSTGSSSPSTMNPRH